MASKPAKKECFVVSQIGDENSPERIHADWLFEEIIEPVTKKDFPDIVVTRADKMNTPGLIDAQIIDKLLNAELVIADLTGLNPNAFYEIGIRHLVQKPIVHMHLSGQNIPFDISLFRSIKFDISQPRHLRTARSQLTNHLKEVLATDYQVENPVTRARGRVQFEATATPFEKSMQESLFQLSTRIKSLEARPPTLDTHQVTPYKISDDTEICDSVSVKLGSLTARKSNQFTLEIGEILPVEMVKHKGNSIHVVLSEILEVSDMASIIHNVAARNDLEVLSLAFSHGKQPNI